MENERARPEADAAETDVKDRLQRAAQLVKAAEERLRREAEAATSAEEERLRWEVEAKAAEEERQKSDAAARVKHEERRQKEADLFQDLWRLLAEAEAARAAEERLRLEAEAAAARAVEERLRLEAEAAAARATDERLKLEADTRAAQAEWEDSRLTQEHTAVVQDLWRLVAEAEAARAEEERLRIEAEAIASAAEERLRRAAEPTPPVAPTRLVRTVAEERQRREAVAVARAAEERQRCEDQGTRFADGDDARWLRAERCAVQLQLTQLHAALARETDRANKAEMEARAAELHHAELCATAQLALGSTRRHGAEEKPAAEELLAETEPPELPEGIIHVEALQQDSVGAEKARAADERWDVELIGAARPEVLRTLHEEYQLLVQV